MNKKRYDLAVLLTVGLACGGVGTVIIMCFFIGFGLHSVIGKEALYLCLLLMALNLWVNRCRERRLQKCGPFPESSTKMRRFRLACQWIWRIAAGLLLLSLVLAICGLRFSGFWVKYPCVIGTAALPVGWLGMLACYHRKRQAIRVMEKESTP